MNQEIKIQNQENDIRQLNIKIEELNKQNEIKFKEKENKINTINNTILNHEKEIEKIKYHFNIEISNIKKDSMFKCFSNQSFKDIICNEISRVEILEKKYAFLSSIGIKILLPKNDYEIEGFIKAPDNSPYKNGIFNFIIKYHENYPIRGPQLIIKTKILHRHVSNDGYCCINLLSNWNKDINLSIILCILYEFFVSNENSAGYHNVAYALLEKNYSLFEKKCQEYVNQYALKDF